MFDSVSYTEEGSIRTVKDDVISVIPDDMSLAERQEVAKWEEGGNEIDQPPQPLPRRVDSVSARQFRLQLDLAELLDDVDAWIATQSKAVQIAYEYSGTFIRNDPMMVAGFSAMGFTEEQIDAFFFAASEL